MPVKMPLLQAPDQWCPKMRQLHVRIMVVKLILLTILCLTAWVVLQCKALLESTVQDVRATGDHLAAVAF